MLNRRTQPAKVYPASSFGGSTNSTVMTATQPSASAFTHHDDRPKSHGPRLVHRPVDRAQSPRPIGSAYDAYSANVLSATTAEYTWVHSPIPSAAKAQAQTPQCGLKNRDTARPASPTPAHPPP